MEEEEGSKVSLSQAHREEQHTLNRGDGNGQSEESDEQSLHSQPVRKKNMNKQALA
jgi:hypothetical protein